MMIRQTDYEIHQRDKKKKMKNWQSSTNDEYRLQEAEKTSSGKNGESKKSRFIKEENRTNVK